MKVAWIITGFATDERDNNGAPAIHKLAEILSSGKDIELDIFSLYYPVNKPEYSYFNARVFSFAEKVKNSRTDKYIIWKKVEKKFNEENSRKKYDVIHSIWSGESGNLASRLAQKHEIPFITSVCGGEVADIPEIQYGSRIKYWQKKFVNNTFKNADRIIISSDFIFRKIKEYYDKNILEKIVKIPFGVDEKIFYPFKSSINYSERSPVLLNIASTVPVKNHKMLFNAFRIVKKRFPKAYLIIGGYDYDNTLKRLSENFEFNDSVSINGFVPYEMMPDVINSADIFVLSSFYESQNLSILESAFCGIPAVSTPVGIAEEVTEYIAEINNFEDFAVKIIRLTENIEDEKNILKEKLSKLKEYYSINSITDKIQNLYKTVSVLYEKH